VIITLGNITHFEYFDHLINNIADIEQVLSSENCESEEVKVFTNQKVKSVSHFLSQHLTPDASVAIDLLEDKYSDFDDNFFSTYADELEYDSEIYKEITRLDRFRVSLKRLVSYLSVVESLIDPHALSGVADINQKTDFILHKLNELFGDEYYSIGLILKLNNISYRSGEPREIAEDLKRRGYLILQEEYGTSDLSKISVKGASYITRKNKRRNKSNEKSEIDIKLDNIAFQLEKLGIGQEVIFNEIDELKSLQHQLSKRTWGQLLKGKLMDMVVDQAIYPEIAESIYSYLMNNSFKILK
jgi:hypothetical protein